MFYDEAGGLSVATAGTFVVATAAAASVVVVGAGGVALFSEGALLFVCWAGFDPNKFLKKLPSLANAPGRLVFSCGVGGEDFLFAVLDFDVEGVRVRVLSFGTASALPVVVVTAAAALLAGGSAAKTASARSGGLESVADAAACLLLSTVSLVFSI